MQAWKKAEEMFEKKKKELEEKMAQQAAALKERFKNLPKNEINQADLTKALAANMAKINKGKDAIEEVRRKKMNAERVGEERIKQLNKKKDAIEEDLTTVRSPGTQNNIPAWVFCMSRCADLESRGDAGEGRPRGVRRGERLGGQCRQRAGQRVHAAVHRRPAGVWLCGLQLHTMQRAYPTVSYKLTVGGVHSPTRSCKRSSRSSPAATG